jgi:hypothetical protein
MTPLNGLSNMVANVKPKASNALLAVLAVMSLAPLGGAYNFFSINPPQYVPAFLFFLTGIGMLAGVFAAWWKSATTQELQGGEIAVVKGADGSLSVHSDTRILFDPERLNAFGQFITTIANRQPLPLPAGGMVDDSFNPIAGSEKEAERRVAEINEAAARAASTLIDSLSASHPTTLHGAAQPTNTALPADEFRPPA